MVTLTLLNMAGIHASSRMQMTLITRDVAGLLAVVVAGLWFGDAAAPASLSWFEKAPSAGAWGLALVFVVLTFGGWNEAA